MIVALGVVAILIALTALYVAAEFAAVGARQSRVQESAGAGSARAAMIVPMLATPQALDHLVAACQVGITATSLILGAYGQAVLARNWVAPWLGEAGLSPVAAMTAAITGTLIALTGLQVLFGELVPKAIALRHPETVIVRLAWPVATSVRVMAPAVALFNGSANAILKGLGRERVSEHGHLHDPGEIEMLVTESRDAGELGTAEHELLANALDLAQLVARQIMIPRNQLDLAEVDTPAPKLVARMAASSLSGMPVYRGTPDSILGIVTLKRLLGLYARGEVDIAPIVETVPYVPESLPVTALWQILVRQPATIAVVLDEYGGTAGVVTRERLVGEVIGESLDEFDPRPEPVVDGPRGHPLVRGDLSVDDVNSMLDCNLPTDRADSVGGLVLDVLGRIAQVGDEVSTEDAVLRVHSMLGNSIAQVEVLRSGPDVE